MGTIGHGSLSGSILFTKSNDAVADCQAVTSLMFDASSVVFELCPSVIADVVGQIAQRRRWHFLNPDPI